MVAVAVVAVVALVVSAGRPCLCGPSSRSWSLLVPVAIVVSTSTRFEQGSIVESIILLEGIFHFS